MKRKYVKPDISEDYVTITVVHAQAEILAPMFEPDSYCDAGAVCKCGTQS